MLYSPEQQHQGGIDIPVTARPTGASMPTLIQPLGVYRPASMTALRRFKLMRGGLSIHDASFCRFVSQDAEKLRRCAIQNCLVQPRLRCCPIGLILPCGGIRLRRGTFRHVRNVQHFRKDGTRCSNELCRLFVMKVQALPRNGAMQLGHSFVGQPPATRELLFGITGTIRIFERRLATT